MIILGEYKSEIGEVHSNFLWFTLQFNNERTNKSLACKFN